MHTAKPRVKNPTEEAASNPEWKPYQFNRGEWTVRVILFTLLGSVWYFKTGTIALCAFGCVYLFQIMVNMLFDVIHWERSQRIKRLKAYNEFVKRRSHE